MKVIFIKAIYDFTFRGVGVISIKKRKVNFFKGLCRSQSPCQIPIVIDKMTFFLLIFRYANLSASGPLDREGRERCFCYNVGVAVLPGSLKKGFL